jgi:hypothetical protein
LISLSIYGRNVGNYRETYAGRWAGPEAELPEGEDRYKLPGRFEKLRVLFNLHRVISAHVVLVEGFFGVFRLHALGVPAVAGSAARRSRWQNSATFFLS